MKAELPQRPAETKAHDSSLSKRVCAQGLEMTEGAREISKSLFSHRTNTVLYAWQDFHLPVFNFLHERKRGLVFCCRQRKKGEEEKTLCVI